ncbi:hypothetical protein, partial [Sphaerochaeta sp.]|uniref:hypothetical protein n=1 Tax=Sphaerochaeta sp. TaxID=1972642 RepID=UPI002A36AF4E
MGENPPHVSVVEVNEHQDMGEDWLVKASCLSQRSVHLNDSLAKRGYIVPESNPIVPSMNGGLRVMGSRTEFLVSEKCTLCIPIALTAS